MFSFANTFVILWQWKSLWKKMKNLSTLVIALYIHTYFHIAELQNGQNDVGYLHKFRSSRSQMFFKICVLKTSANFIGKHLCWSLFLLKLQALRTATLLKGAFRCFPVKFVNFLRTPFSTVLQFSVRNIFLSCGKDWWEGNSVLSIFIFSVPFCEFNSLLQPNFERKNKLLRFDGIDNSLDHS